MKKLLKKIVLNQFLKSLMIFLVERLKEKTTVTALIGFITTNLGYHFIPEMQGDLANLIVALNGLFLILLTHPESKIKKLEAKNKQYKENLSKIDEE